MPISSLEGIVFSGFFLFTARSAIACPHSQKQTLYLGFWAAQARN
jgi:hypothetical protein